MRKPRPPKHSRADALRQIDRAAPTRAARPEGAASAQATRSTPVIIGMNRDRFWSLLAAQTGVVFMSPSRASARSKLPTDAELRAAHGSKPRSQPKPKPKRTTADRRRRLAKMEQTLARAEPNTRRRMAVARMDRVLQEAADEYG